MSAQVNHKKELAYLLAWYRRGLMLHMKKQKIQNVLELEVNHTPPHLLPQMFDQARKRVQVCMSEQVCKTVLACIVA